MRKKYLIIFYLIFLPHIIYSQWTIQYTIQNIDLGFNEIIFPSDCTGYAYGSIYPSYLPPFCKTTNAGINWFPISLPSFINITLNKSSFFNNDTGFICGRGPIIFKTTNGGINWTYKLAPIYLYGNQTYNFIKFFNTESGIIAGRYGMIAKTTNGGNNWFCPDTTSLDLNCGYFINENTGFLGDVSSGIYKTTNCGFNWNYTEVYDSLPPHYYYTLMQIKFVNNITGYAIGMRVNPTAGALFKTTDGGNSWKNALRIIGEGKSFYSIDIIGNTIYIATSGPNIIKSIDNGLNWTTQQLPLQWGMSSIKFLSENIGCGCGYTSIIRTTNGGSVFINNISNNIPGEYKLYQNYPNPFNSMTKIKFSVSVKKSEKWESSLSHLLLKVYNILGEEISVLVNEKLKPGTYETNFYNNNLTSGIYFYCLLIDNIKYDTKKFVVLK